MAECRGEWRRNQRHAGAAAGGGERRPWGHAGTIEEALAELDMEHYDDDAEDGGGGRPFGAGRPGMSFYR